MKKIFFLISLFLAAFVSNKAGAQTGWQWVIGNDTADVIIESGASAADPFGNVFTSYITEGGTITVGGVTVIDSAGLNLLVYTKADSAGNFLWTVGTQYANTWSWDIANDGAGNMYGCGVYDNDSFAIGSYVLHNPGHSKIYFLVKISPSGTVLWAQNICKPGDYFWGWSSDVGVQTDAAGNIYITGTFDRATVTIGGVTLVNMNVVAATSDIFLAKFSPSGAFIWAKRYGGPNDDFINDIDVTPAGNIYISGTYDSSTTIDTVTLNDSMVYLAKFDSSGNFLWAENLLSPMVVNGLATDASEQVYLSGMLKSSVVLGTDTLNVTDSAFVIAKYGTTGNVLWARSATGVGEGYGISRDRCSRVWVCGQIDNTMDFGAGPLTAPLGLDPMFIASYDTAGNFKESAALSSGGDDFVDINVDYNGNVFVCGDFVKDIFIVGHDTIFDPYAFNSSEDLFIAKYNYDTIGCTCNGAPITPSFTSSGVTTIQFTYTGTTVYDSLKWHFGDGTTSTAVNPVHTYTASGTYNVCVDLFSSCVSDRPYAQYCDTVNITTGIANIIKAGGIYIYPNPVTNALNITAPNNIQCMIISNSLGQCVYRKTATAGSASQIIDVSDFPPGIYFIKINDSLIKEFVKE